MQKQLINSICCGLIVKVAFIYTDSRRMDYMKPSVRPTYRISMQVLPKLKPPTISAALSDITKQGEIKPIVIMKARL